MADHDPLDKVRDRLSRLRIEYAATESLVVEVERLRSDSDAESLRVENIRMFNEAVGYRLEIEQLKGSEQTADREIERLRADIESRMDREAAERATVQDRDATILQVRASLNGLRAENETAGRKIERLQDDLSSSIGRASAEGKRAERLANEIATLREVIEKLKAAEVVAGEDCCRAAELANGDIDRLREENAMLETQNDLLRKTARIVTEADAGERVSLGDAPDVFMTCKSCGLRPHRLCGAKYSDNGEPAKATWRCTGCCEPQDGEGAMASALSTIKGLTSERDVAWAKNRDAAEAHAKAVDVMVKNHDKAIGRLRAENNRLTDVAMELAELPADAAARTECDRIRRLDAIAIDDLINVHAHDIHKFRWDRCEGCKAGIEYDKETGSHIDDDNNYQCKAESLRLIHRRARIAQRRLSVE